MQNLKDNLTNSSGELPNALVTGICGKSITGKLGRSGRPIESGRSITCK